MEDGRLVVCIRHDSAELWGFRFGLTLDISNLKIMVSIGVFVRVICAQISFIGASQTPSTT
jgi:hypothetical protein